MPRKRTIAVSCTICGRDFFALKRQQRCCSPECASALDAARAAAARVVRTCAQCGTEFAIVQSRAATARFCSMACHSRAMTGEHRAARVELTCAQCGGMFVVRESQVRKGKGRSTYCSRACKSEAEQRQYVKRRNGMLAQYWRSFVLDRDGHRCQSCGSTAPPLHAHHIHPWADFPAGRFDPANGVTLCKDCHQHVHRKAA